MKSIKPLLLVSFSLSIVFTLQAQQQEEKTIKPLPAALTKSPAGDEKSAIIPAPKEIKADAVQAAPSPLTREDGTKAKETENTTLKAVAVDAKGATSQLTPEQMNTLNGKATLPKQSTLSTGTEKSKPLPLSKPAIAKEQ